MYEIGFDEQNSLLVFVYGLIFFSIGISILVQPRGETRANTGPDFWLLGTFGILHGIAEWLVLLEGPESGGLPWDHLRFGSLALSFLSLFEFGRRLLAGAAAYTQSSVTAALARPGLAYLLPLMGGAALLLGEPGLEEAEAWFRYTLALPGALLSGIGFLQYAAVCEVAAQHKAARRGLHIAGLAFFAYAIAAGWVVAPSDLYISQVINASSFFQIFGVPIELVRILIGGVLLVGMARRIQAVNSVTFSHLLEARGEANALRQRSELILELVDDGVVGLDEFGNVSFANAAARRMLGYMDKELLGMSFCLLRFCNHRDERYREGERRCPVFPHPDHYRSESEFFIPKDGTPFPVEYTSAPKYEQGGLKGGVIAFRDISERRQLEVAQRWEQDERFDALFEQAAVGIAVVSLEGQCLQVNSRLSSMLGYSSATMTGANFTDFIHPDEREQCSVLRRQLGGDTTPASPSVEGRCIRHDGSSVWAQLRFAMVRDCAEAPRYCFVAVEDISVRKQAERIREYYQTSLEQQVEERTRALAKANHELASTNRELEAFSYSVSHDLRSPLRAINGFTHALAEDYGHLLDEIALGYIEKSQTATDRMGKLIDCLLNLSQVFRIDLAFTFVDLSQLCRETVEQLEQRYPERQVTVDIEQGLETSGDATLLRLLLENLMDNAWKFTAGCDQASIRFGRTVCDGREAYFVSDNGIGFENEYVHKLFQPFERLHAEADYKGMGIGLATVRRIVQRHNGVAWAEGTMGKGAIFYFTLPSAHDNVDTMQRVG